MSVPSGRYSHERLGKADMDDKQENVEWIEKKVRDGRGGPCEGMWMVYYPQERLLPYWYRLCKMVDDGELDVPRMAYRNERSGAISVYTDGDERSKIAIGKKLVNTLIGNYKEKCIYWKAEWMTLRGTTATGTFFNSADDLTVPKKLRGSTKKGRCDVCDRRTTGKKKRLGRCAHCRDVRRMWCTSGTYTGMLYTDILLIPVEDRTRHLSDEDKEVIEYIEKCACRFCYSFKKKKIPYKLPCCWQCFQTGHVTYSSGRYNGESVMIVADRRDGYDGSDLVGDDVELHEMAKEAYKKFHSYDDDRSDYGPLRGCKWASIPLEGPWREYKMDRSGKSDGLVGYCATREHLATGDVVDNRPPVPPRLIPIPHELVEDDSD